MKRRISFILTLILLAASLISCGADAFDKAIENLAPTSQSIYTQVADVAELLEKPHPNLVVRAKVKSRGESAVIDYSGEYDGEFLSSDASDEEKQICAQSYITTQYELSDIEVILGTQPDVTVKLDMPYGIVGDYSRRAGGYPILEVGAEYLLFLRTDYMYGRQVFYLALPPVSAVKLDGDRIVGIEPEDRIFGGFGGDYNALRAELDRLIAENEYDLIMESVGFVKED